MEHTLTCVLVLLSTADSVNLTFHTPGTFTSAIRNSQQLVVHQRLTVPPSIVDQSVEKALTSCCCFGQGTISAHVRLERDKAQPGEEVQVVVEVDNRSKQAVRKIEVCLKQEAEGRDMVGRHNSRRRWHREHSKADHPGLQPFTMLQGGLARRLALRLPSALPPSMRGSLITCDYFVKVSLKFSGMVRELKMKVPIIVAAPQPIPTTEEPFYREVPPFWSPSVVASGVEAINVPSAPPLPQELLQPDGPFWSRARSNASSDSLSAPLLGGPAYSVV
ncbi:hypothetical protein CHLNCDRAFT_133415 [Chlorella variabilis]|uniref:Arrestin C-terminal-like domain-containing protein n=1 Tax=Chlorella variabilis TaxID=554065 RepID=E1Z321_CHLVA|nr:hypothetical protein CHLNCDRAFT_133415 [Chlorella variabilis]EFN59763.1 hypothetical protein CHLNCDRAFT_133415 [Chlorella variabilis]|eukprot:XP_005851865.1 hypothetical protein CHLNCDRAFT_133415 [Chlorella variabilis]